MRSADTSAGCPVGGRLRRWKCGVLRVSELGIVYCLEDHFALHVDYPHGCFVLVDGEACEQRLVVRPFQPT